MAVTNMRHCFWFWPKRHKEMIAVQSCLLTLLPSYRYAWSLTLISCWSPRSLLAKNYSSCKGNSTSLVGQYSQYSKCLRHLRGSDCVQRKKVIWPKFRFAYQVWVWILSHPFLSIINNQWVGDKYRICSITMTHYFRLMFQLSLTTLSGLDHLFLCDLRHLESPVDHKIMQRPIRGKVMIITCDNNKVQ